MVEEQDKPSQNSEDELSIDLSKVKSFFKKFVKEDSEKKAEVKEEVKTEATEEQKQEVKEESKTSHEKKDDEGLDLETVKKSIKSVDWKSLGKFFIKYQIILLILIPLILSIHLRAMPADLPITEQWAKSNVHNALRQQISGQVKTQYPNLPAAQRNNLVDEAFNELLETRKGEVDQQVEQMSGYFKQQFQDEDGQTYLLAIDPYYYLRHARSLVEKGHVGDYQEDGIPYNKLQTAPGDHPAERHFHMYLTAYTYKFLSFFSSNISLMAVAFYMPVLLATLAIIPAFFIARRFGGNVAGLVAAVMLAISPSFLSRTVGGFSDTDAYTVTLPLFIAWIFLLAFDATDKKKMWSMAALSGVLVGFFSLTWSGWWYIFDFLLATTGIYALYLLVKLYFKKDLKNALKNTEIRNMVSIAGIFILVGMVSTAILQWFRSFSLTTGIETAFFWFRGPLGIIQLKEAIRGDNWWPNVLTTVAELNPANFTQIVNSIGGQLFFAIAILGIILTFLPKGKDKKIDIKHGVFLSLWFIGTIYAATKGVRFILLLTPAFALAFGIAIGSIYQLGSKWFGKLFQIDAKWFKLAGIIVIALFLIDPIQNARGQVRGTVPSMNDGWYQSLKVVESSTEPDAIISSWWDFGHWFKYVADRGTTFDGASQALPQAHWIGNSLLTNSEKESVGILRMLDCSGNDAFKLLHGETDDFLLSIDTIYKTLEKDRQEAIQIYTEELGDQNLAYKAADLSHCENPPEAIYITSEDMIGKSGVWSHFGSWNFTRAALINIGNSRSKEEFMDFTTNRLQLSETESNDLYNKVRSLGTGGAANSWIAPWPSYQGGQSGCGYESDDYLVCENGARINLTTMDATVRVQQGEGLPYSVVYVDGDELKEKIIDPAAGLSVVLIPANEKPKYRSMLVQKPHGMGMFTRLFFLEGHGLDHFQKLSDIQAVNGWRIIVWKVDWEGNSSRVVDQWTNWTNVETKVEPTPVVDNLSKIEQEKADILEEVNDS